MMRTTERVCLAALVSSGIILAQTATPKPVQTVKPGVVQVSPLAVCADPAVTLAISKNISAGTGVITLTGKVCNEGPGNYATPKPLDAYFMVYTWHPPKTPAQEGNVQTFSHNAVATPLGRGDCKPVTQTYQIPNVISWGNTTPTAGQRQAVKEFVIRVQKDSSGASFSKQENCSLSNDTKSIDIPYMEKAQ
jgi:hypothetical protein